MTHIEALTRATTALAQQRCLMTSAGYKAALAAKIEEFKPATGHALTRGQSEAQKHPQQGPIWPAAARNGHALPCRGNGGG